MVLHWVAVGRREQSGINREPAIDTDSELPLEAHRTAEILILDFASGTKLQALVDELVAKTCALA